MKWEEKRTVRALEYIGVKVNLKERPHIEGIIKHVTFDPSMKMKSMLKQMYIDVQFKDTLAMSPVRTKLKYVYVVN